MTTNAQAPAGVGTQASPPASGSRRFVWLLSAGFLLLLLAGGSVGGVWWRLHFHNANDDSGPTEPGKPAPLETCNDETDPKYLKRLDFGEPLNTPFDRRYLDALANRAIPKIERYSWQPKELVAVLGEHRMRGNVFAVSPDGKLLAVAATFSGYVRIGKLETLHESVVFASPAVTTALAWSPDGTTLAVLGGDSQVRLYDVRDLGKISEPVVLKGRGTLAPSLAYSGDGKYLLTGSSFQTAPDLPVVGFASVWDVKAKTPKIVRELRHSGPVLHVAFSPVPGDYRALTAGGPGDGQLHLWAAVDDKEIGTIDFRPEKAALKNDKVTYVGEVVFSPDGKQALSAHHYPANPAQGPSTVRVWDLDHFEKGHERQILEGHIPGTAALAFSPDGKHVATGRLTDGSVALWNIRKDKGKAELRRLAAVPAVYSLRFVGDQGDRLLYAGTFSNDYNLHVLDVATGKELSPPRGHLTAVSCVAAAPDGQRVASTGGDYYLRLWDLKTVEQRFRVWAGLTWSVGFHPDAKRVYYCSLTTGTLPFLGVEKGEARTPPYSTTHHGAIYTAAITRDGRYALTGGYQDATARLWRLSDGVQVRYFDLKPDNPAQGMMATVALSPDMIRAVATCGGKTFLLHLRCQERKHEWNPVRWPVFLPDGRVAFFGAATTPVWAVKEAVQEADPLRLNLSATTGPQLSADGRRVAATTGGKALVYDVSSGRLVWEWSPPPHFGGISGVALLPDGQHLLTANGDGTVYVIRLP